MLDFLAPISSILGFSNADIAVVGTFVILSLILAATGSNRAYSAFYGTVIGIGIYIVLQTLLSSAYQTPATIRFFGPKVSEFIVGSAAYLIFILSLLSAANGPMQVRTSENPGLRFLESFFISAGTCVLITATALGFSWRTYVFLSDTAFTLIGTSGAFWVLLSTSKMLTWIVAHLREIVLFSILFGIYKAFFAEIISWAILAMFRSIFRKRWGGQGASVHEETPESEEMFEEDIPHGHHHGH